MEFSNAYDDAKRAKAYAQLQFPGTYYLAFRDLPNLIAQHVSGTIAMDFGCGAGRSTRFLQSLGFKTIGVDISQAMLSQAAEFDPHGDYRLLDDSDFESFPDHSFDLILSAFTFDNVPRQEQKTGIMSEFARLLKRTGRFVNLVSTPEIYCHEWASFSTRDFPENRSAKPGEIVKIINTDTSDARPVDDILWPDENYRDVYREAGLEVLSVHKPLGGVDEPFHWINEAQIAPWVIYVLGV